MQLIPIPAVPQPINQKMPFSAISEPFSAKWLGEILYKQPLIRRKSEAKVGRPLRHGHCRRAPIAVAQSEIKGQGKERPPAEHKSAEQFLNIKIRSRARRRARSFTYHCAISSRRTSAGYHRHYCRIRCLIIYRKPFYHQVHREH